MLIQQAEKEYPIMQQSGPSIAEWVFALMSRAGGSAAAAICSAGALENKRIGSPAPYGCSLEQGLEEVTLSLPAAPVTSSFPLRDAAPPGKIFSIFTIGCTLDSMPPEMLIPEKHNGAMNGGETGGQELCQHGECQRYCALWTTVALIW